MVPAATHDCSTLGGNSGSAVIDLDTGEVLALHFGGLYHQKNYSVPSSELARDAPRDRHRRQIRRRTAGGTQRLGATGGRAPMPPRRPHALQMLARLEQRRVARAVAGARRRGRLDGDHAARDR